MLSISNLLETATLNCFGGIPHAINPITTSEDGMFNKECMALSSSIVADQLRVQAPIL